MRSIHAALLDPICDETELRYNDGMSTGILLLFGCLLIGGLAVIYMLLKQDMENLRRSMDTTQNTVTSSLTKNTADIHDRLLHAAEVIADLKKEAGAFTEVSRSMKGLQEYLKSPKLRGNIGEQVLKDLIGQMFPKNSFHLQYAFRSGNKVDAAIKTDAGILPVDSKFPMENFQAMMGAESTAMQESYRVAFTRDIRKHVTDISKKYILPDEGTLDFALMYVPSESVYYEISGDVDLMEFARKNRVYPVSPNTMYAALQTIMLSFEGKKIEGKAKEVFKLLRAIEKDFGKTTVHLTTLGSHLTNAFNKYSEVNNSFNSLGQKLTSSRELIATEDEEKLIKE